MTPTRRAWVERNRERVREYTRKHRAKNLDAHRTQTREHWRSKRGCPAPTRPVPELCECCGRLPSEKRVLALDHCHETGKFRGWLCHRCNTALGLLGDSIEKVKLALAYLERDQC
jgi:hypothetical protein